MLCSFVESSNVPLDPGDHGSKSCVERLHKWSAEPPDEEILACGDDQEGQRYDCQPGLESALNEKFSRPRVGFGSRRHEPDRAPNIQCFRQQKQNEAAPVDDRDHHKIGAIPSAAVPKHDALRGTAFPRASRSRHEPSFCCAFPRQAMTLNSSSSTQKMASCAKSSPTLSAVKSVSTTAKPGSA